MEVQMQSQSQYDTTVHLLKRPKILFMCLQELEGLRPSCTADRIINTCKNFLFV